MHCLSLKFSQKSLIAQRLNISEVPDSFLMNIISSEIEKRRTNNNYTGKYFVIARPGMLRKLNLDLCSISEYRNQCALIDNVYFIESFEIITKVLG